MDVNDLPKELLSQIKMLFESDPRIVELRNQQKFFQRTGKYASALEIAKKLDVLYGKCVQEYMNETERQVETIDVSDTDIPEEEKEKMMQYLLSCFMCADMMKSAIQDMNSILYKYDKSMRVETFDDLKQVLDMCEAKLKYLQENSGYLQDLVWGEKCDDMYSMVNSKARSIMRKRKDSENWGKNTLNLKR